jgi:hypothetical protein
VPAARIPEAARVVTAGKRPVVVVDCGRWTATIAGPVRYTVPAVRQACGTSFTVEYDNRARRIRVPAGKAADVVAALELAKVKVQLRGRLPDPELWSA